MFTWLKKALQKEPKPSNNFPIDVEKLLKRCKTLGDYIKVLELTIDKCCSMFEEKFEYKDKNRIYILLANIFARSTEHSTFTKEEDKNHFDLLSIILNRSGTLNENLQFENFENSIKYIEEILAMVDIDDNNAAFLVSNAYASYLYPDEELYKLTLQAVMINDFFKPIKILAKHQKRFL